MEVIVLDKGSWQSGHMKQDQRLLSAKELAAHLSRHPKYVYAATKRGMPNIAGRYELQRSANWLSKHPRPRARH
jgi:hypothetical protein